MVWFVLQARQISVALFSGTKSDSFARKLLSISNHSRGNTLLSHFPERVRKELIKNSAFALLCVVRSPVAIFYVDLGYFALCCRYGPVDNPVR